MDLGDAPHHRQAAGALVSILQPDFRQGYPWTQRWQGMAVFAQRQSFVRFHENCHWWSGILWRPGTGSELRSALATAAANLSQPGFECCAGVGAKLWRWLGTNPLHRPPDREGHHWKTVQLAQREGPMTAASAIMRLPYIAERRLTMLRWGCLLSFLVIGMTLDLASQDRAYGRSVVMTERGIVATSHYLASQAGAQVLARGGTAMDAAIAANAVLGVTEPMMN